MRKDVIAHPAQAQLVIIREDYLAICDGDHCAAAILNIFEFWTEVKLSHREQAEIHNQIAESGDQPATQDTEDWIYKAQPDLQDELLGLFGETKVSKGLALLVKKGYLATRNNPKFLWDRTLQYHFNAEVVQAAVYAVKIRGASRKNTASKPQKKGIKGVDKRHRGRKNKAAIPKTPPQDTPEDTSGKDRFVAFDDFEDIALQLYPCTEADVNALIATWWEWVPVRPTRRGKVIDAHEHFANISNREYAQSMYRRGVRPADFAECLGEKRNHPPEGGWKEMTFAYAARIVEEWVKNDRDENFYTDDCPRVIARKPGVVIDLGELAGVEGAELAERLRGHPDLLVDVPPPYITPQEAEEMETDTTKFVDVSQLEGMPEL